MGDFIARLLLLYRKASKKPQAHRAVLIHSQGVSTYPLSFQGFTDFSTLINQFSAWTSQLTQSKAAGYPYFLREMGVVG